MSQDEIDDLIQSGEAEDDTSTEEQVNAEKKGKTVDKPQFDEMEPAVTDPGFPALDPKFELLYDLQLPISIELGRTNMLIRDILRLSRGSVIEFDKLVSEPVDVLINGKKVAEGEVVVIDKHFGIRVTTLISPSERLRSVKG